MAGERLNRCSIALYLQKYLSWIKMYGLKWLLKVFFEQKWRLQLHAYKDNSEEGSSNILLCADSFVGRQALILING